MRSNIKFNNNFKKLHNQTKAKIINIEFNYLSKLDDEFIKIDTEMDNGKFYKLEEGFYMILTFIGNKGISFRTLRKYTATKLKSYSDILQRNDELQAHEKIFIDIIILNK